MLTFPMRLPLRLRRRRSLAAPAAADLTALLGRKAVNLDTPELQKFLAGKTILVSGAGGSIGSEICRQAMRFCPGRLVLLDRSEPALFEIDQELRHRWVGSRIDPMIGDVTDRRRIEHIVNQTRPHVIFHAAAHKHVPMMELNPGEAIKNNVLGTQILADAAAAFAVDAFVMISTDKAVNPTSVMGATKRMAEVYVQSLNKGVGNKGQRDKWTEGHSEREESAANISSPDISSPDIPSPFAPLPLSSSVSYLSSSPRFLAVRFGNVIGSSGSVIPIFQKQIAAGGPVTVTHADMKRYFMTIPEASQLVMQAGAIGQGGEIFILDMGEPVRIIELAREMIQRAGLREGHDIELRVTGVRPGEKLYEELACDDEQTRPTAHQKIRIWQLVPTHPATVRHMLDRLYQVIDAPAGDVVAALSECIPEYSSHARTRESAAQPNVLAALPPERSHRRDKPQSPS